LEQVLNVVYKLPEDGTAIPK